MEDFTGYRAAHRVPWNKGKLTGQKPPLRPKHVWSIRSRLQVDGRIRDLAMFNLAIDSKLRGCDVVCLKVEDVAPHGIAIDRATVRQRKTCCSVRFELTEQTRESVDAYLRAAAKKSGEFLFPGRRHRNRSLTTRQYARLVLSPNGSAASDSIQGFSAPTRYDAPRLRSFTGGPAIFAPYNYSWAIEKSKVPFDISG